MIKSIFGIIVLLAIFIILEINRELHRFVVTHYDISLSAQKKDSEKMDGCEDTVVFLSDLHLHQYGTNNEKLLKEIQLAHPTYIFVGGDLIVGKSKASVDSLFPFLEEVAKIAPMIYCNGNHEHRVKENPQDYMISYADYKKRLESYGVIFLENTSLHLELCRKTVCVTGLEIPLSYYTHFKKVDMDPNEMERCIGKKDASCYQILLAHNPQYMRHYLQWGADLVLSGHLHGGIVRIPGVLGVISPAFDLFPKYSGDHYKVGDQDVIVSKGLGTHTVNIRLFNPAELVVLHFIS